MPKLPLMGDNKLSALLTWSNLKPSLTTTETLWAACGQSAGKRLQLVRSKRLASLEVPKLEAMTAIDLAFLAIRSMELQGGSDERSFKEAAAELNVQRRQTCSGRSENGNDSQPVGSLWELKSMFKLPSPRKLFRRNTNGDKARQSADTSDTSVNPYEQALPADERVFTHWVTEPVLEGSVSPDVANNWSDVDHCHLISMTMLDDDYIPDDTDESCGHTGPSMAELMKEAFYQQQHPDSFLESDFPAHDFHEMVSDLPTASHRANSSPPAIESDHSLALLLKKM
eukprot:gene28913-32107_t